VAWGPQIQHKSTILSRKTAKLATIHNPPKRPNNKWVTSSKNAIID